MEEGGAVKAKEETICQNKHFKKEVFAMPGFDGTGPMGQGPRTGGGRGFCTRAVESFPPKGYLYRTYPYRYHPCSRYGCGFGAGRGGFSRRGSMNRVFGGGREE